MAAHSPRLKKLAVVRTGENLYAWSSEIRMDDVLRNARLHIPAEKINGYLLSQSHPAGSSKARFYISQGFDPVSLSISLSELARSGTVVEKELTIHGVKYVIDGDVDSPRGGRIRLRSVWISPEDSLDLHFVTAYPGRRRP